MNRRYLENRKSEKELLRIIASNTEQIRRVFAASNEIIAGGNKDLANVVHALVGKLN